MSAPQTIHAGCVLVGEAGLLIRGASGSGKSTLAREVVSLALRAGRFGRLVSDDRTRIEARHGRLLARPVEPLDGCIEIFGLGIVRRPFEPAAIIRLVIDLCEDVARYPEDSDRRIALCGVMIPRVRMQAGASSADIALGCLSGVCDTVVTL
ncbi:serine kinase of HPr protein (carbohydrate metabolism regulator) [Microvirga flocculans]|uniref:Serine kinase of HPr protein (Carbohydrate metabolism regulator) n=1 Tax=Microvirga flocculans TaxID=217168 RepID=A0A7W6IC16_9HYPH|nr:serine/threonine protein kinase [Microvirga flocculans]MBB4038659.1 serine kinase of HPr protein (carbohydrate metabolism regulator) [Microvirga flocculans]